jgi:hypothetical protein
MKKIKIILRSLQKVNSLEIFNYISFSLSVQPLALARILVGFRFTEFQLITIPEMV